MSMVQVTLVASAGVLVVSALLGLYRLARGPSGLDRAVAADLMIAILIASIGIHAVWERTGVALIIVLVLSLVGFTGAVGMARLVTGSTLRERRYREAEARAAHEAAPRRDPAGGLPTPPTDEGEEKR